MRTAQELDSAWVKLEGDRHALYVEELCPFRREVAIIVTRGQDGHMVRYPAVETVNREHICHVTKGPVRVPLLGDMPERAITAFDGVGSFGMELFEMADGRLLVNEIAPRVHNTGHYTMVASLTDLPVIGVPVESKSLRGMDSLLSIVQMPGGVPVATVAIGNAKNAGLLAVRILGTGDARLREGMTQYRARMAAESQRKNESLGASI